MITMERASEIVKALREQDGDMAIDLFCHFESLLNPNKQICTESQDWTTSFAVMCGYNLASSITILKEGE